MTTITSILGEFKKRKGFQKILGNTTWLVSQKIIQLGVGLVVNVLVARYLGPEKYGILSYAFSVITFLSTFVYLGLSGLVVRDIVRHPDNKDLLLGTTFTLKFTGSMFGFLAVVAVAFFTHDIGGDEFWILLIIGLSLFARPFEIIDFWFQSQVQSKYSVVAQTTAFIIASIIKVMLVFFGASVIAFAVASSIQGILVAVLLVFIYSYKGFSLFHWKFSLLKAIQLLGQSWILIFAGFFALANFKVDQIMLRWLSGPAEVGIYSVAVTFSEIWYFIPSAIVMSIFPRLIHLKDTDAYEKKLQQVFDFLFFLAITVAIFMAFAAKSLILFLYGEVYARSGVILSIHVWAGVFMFNQQLINKWVLMENILFFHLANHGCAAILNIILNLVLISKYGGLGAAISTLISYAASSYFFLFIYPKTRSLAIKISKSYILPFRLAFYGATMLYR